MIKISLCWHIFYDHMVLLINVLTDDGNWMWKTWTSLFNMENEMSETSLYRSLFHSITSTSCQSCLQTTTWITVRRRWMRWMQPCQTWRLLWREERHPTHWYDNTVTFTVGKLFCVSAWPVFVNPCSLCDCFSCCEILALVWLIPLFLCFLMKSAFTNSIK